MFVFTATDPQLGIREGRYTHASSGRGSLRGRSHGGTVVSRKRVKLTQIIYVECSELDALFLPTRRRKTVPGILCVG